MKFRLLASAMAAVCVCSGNLAADDAKDAWAKLVTKKMMRRSEFAYPQRNEKLPNVFIYGDSISMHYMKPLREELDGVANVYRMYCNGGDTGRYFERMPILNEVMRDPMLEGHWDFDWQVIQLNFGLHDMKYLDAKGNYTVEDGKQVRSIEDYQANLRKIFDDVKKNNPKAKIIFATTTPVPENSRGRIAGDAKKYNQAALEVLKDYPEIVVNDLYALSKPHQSEWAKAPTDVHYNSKGQRAQAEQVAKVIKQVLAD